jgi:hypothetical protein
MALFYEILNYICFEKTNFDSKYLFSFIFYTYYRATYVQFFRLAFPGPEPVENKVVWNVRCCAELYSFTLH